MKKIKFLPVLMALFMGLTFGLTSCGDDDDDNSGNDTQKESVVEDDVINNGRTFYDDLGKAASGDAVAIADIIVKGADYTAHKDDKTYTTNFLAGVVMQKYGVDDAKVAKGEEYLNKVETVKTVLDNGITSENVSEALIKLATFISSK